LDFIPFLFVGIFSFTLSSVVIISIILKHVHTKLPLLSTSGSKRPESFFFGFGLCLSGGIWFVLSFLQLMRILNLPDVTIAIQAFNIITNGIISNLTGLCLGLLGLFNYSGESETSYIHICLTNGFIGFAILTMFFMSGLNQLTGGPLFLFIWRFICAFTSMISAYLFIGFYGMAYSGKFMSSDEIESAFQTVVKNEEGIEIEIIEIPLTLKISAIFEYFGALVFCVYVISYYYDLISVSIIFEND